MYTIKSPADNHDPNKIFIEQPKARAQRLNDVLSACKGGRMSDKRKSRASQKQQHLKILAS